MDRLLINGGKKLNGTVNIESAKNSVLPILAGCVLTNDTVVINNCPKITDVLNMVKILKHIGAKAYFEKNNLIVNCSNICNSEIPKVLSKELRASVLMVGALLARTKKAKISFPGGCNIGIRPIDIHLNSFKKLGAYVDMRSFR